MDEVNEPSECHHSRRISSLKVPARREAFEALRAHLATTADRLRIPERERSHLLIAADEIFSNIAEYAYPDGSGTVEVQLAANLDGSELSLIFADRGIPFDPLATTPPDTAAPLADRRIGGLGIHVVRRLMDRVAYRRTDDGRNLLTLTKRLPTTAEAHP